MLSLIATEKRFFSEPWYEMSGRNEKAHFMQVGNDLECLQFCDDLSISCYRKFSLLENTHCQNNALKNVFGTRLQFCSRFHIDDVAQNGGYSIAYALG